ncbi:MAG: hypothetical protein QMD05_03545 [Candidatus Brocadiaceae bacterium]|nr:hypothetical protein [Candidatus Brocadiaceae bacterium]
MGKGLFELRGLLKFPGFGLFTRFNNPGTRERESRDKGQGEKGQKGCKGGTVALGRDETSFSKR